MSPWAFFAKGMANRKTPAHPFGIGMGSEPFPGRIHLDFLPSPRLVKAIQSAILKSYGVC